MPSAEKIMNLSMEIIADALNEYYPEKNISSDQFAINKVRFLSGDIDMEPDALYIGRLKDLFTNGNNTIICDYVNSLILSSY